MRKILVLFFLVPTSAPALAVYKCESGENVSYSDRPCSNGRSVGFDAQIGSEPLSQDAENAKQRAAREKAELTQIEIKKQQRQAQEEKERQKFVRANAVKLKKCSDLDLQRKWAEEDAVGATGKTAEKIKRSARRKTEKFRMECGK